MPLGTPLHDGLWGTVSVLPPAEPLAAPPPGPAYTPPAAIDLGVMLQQPGVLSTLGLYVVVVVLLILIIHLYVKVSSLQAVLAYIARKPP